MEFRQTPRGRGVLLSYSGLKCHEKIGLGVVRPRTAVYFNPKEMRLNA